MGRLAAPETIQVTGEPGGAGVPWRLRFARGLQFSLATPLDCLDAWNYSIAAASSSAPTWTGR